MVVRYRRRRGEVVLADLYCSLEEGVLGRTAPALSDFCSGGFQNTQSTQGNRFFDPAVFYSCRAPREFLLCGNFSSLRKSRAKVYLDG
jgi:hypothetical protein